MSEHETPDEQAGGVEHLAPVEEERFEKALALLSSGGGVLALAQRGGMQLEGLGVYEALLVRSWQVRYHDPKEMCHLARAAVEMCDGFAPEGWSAERVADLKARAWGELANAYRVADRLLDSGKTFGTAFGFYRQGTGDRRLRMRLLGLEASLLGTQREFDLTLQRLSILARLYREAGEIHLSGRTLIKKALYAFYKGDLVQACEAIQEGLSQIDAKREPSLALAAFFNQLLFLVEAGDPDTAKRILFKSRSRLTGHGRIAELKLRWIQGRIDYASRRYKGAEAAFREARDGFAEMDKPLAGALAGLELAMTLMRLEGREDEALQEGLAAAEVFLRMDIHREILGTVIFLQGALRERTADVALLETTVRFLRRRMMELGLG